MQASASDVGAIEASTFEIGVTKVGVPQGR